MLTVLEAINLSTEYLLKKDIESARLNAELFLADILKISRIQLYVNFERPLSEDEKNKYRDFIARRGKGEPLQYILGYTEFFGYKFFVNPDVLIPRPETEILIETILNEISKKNNYKLLDIGTGSGIIPITISMENEKISSDGIDISENAIITAKKNAEYHGVEKLNNFFILDIMHEEILSLPEYEIIVSNPPYVDKEEYKTLQKEIIDHEPSFAVTDNGDGFSFYKRISEISGRILKQGGIICFEIGKNQSNKVMEIMSRTGFTEIKIIKDLSGIERVVVGKKA